jgi:hypothetical protein
MIAKRSESADRLEGELHLKIGSMANHAETKPARAYWFKCPSCAYDWASWLKPSIIFVSLSFVTDRCPNCRKKHVQAYRVEEPC